MYQKNVAGQFCHFQGVSASTGGILSGATFTVRRCIDGTFAAGGGTVTEDSTNGWYKYAMSQADTNGNNLGFNFTATGAVPQTVNCITTAGNPTDGVRFGLSALPNAAAAASGGLVVLGANAAGITINAAAGTDALQLNGGAASGATPAGNALTAVGGAASTTGGGVAGNAFKLTGGAGAASTNGAVSGMVVAGGGTNTVGSAAHAVAFTGASSGNGLNVQGGSSNNTDAMKCLANGSGGYGLDLIGNVSGAGLICAGGTTGAGIAVTAGGTSGIGLSIQTSNGDGISVNPTSGHAFTLTANGSGKHGLNITAGTGGHGITATGGAAVTTTAAGHGIIATGGASSTGVGGTAGNGFNLAGGAGSASQNGAADGLKSSAGGTTTVSGAAGFNLLGSGAIAGFLTTGGATGPGARFVGGATSGNSIDQAVTSGNAWINANATAINAVSTSSVTTINANQGTTQPINFTGTAGAALVKVDVTDWNGTAVSAPATAGIPDVNVKNAGNVAWASGSITTAVFAAGAINRAALSVDSGLQTIRSNTAQAGGATSITLDAGASATDNLYKYASVYITGGTGVGQAARIITGYVGSTKVATVTPAWTTNPDATTTFAIESTGVADVESWEAVVPNALVSGRVDASIGANNAGNLTANVIQWNSTNVAAPATAGIPDVNVKNMNNVAATSITTINANQGTTQPINFTGTGASALVKVDVTDIATVAVNTGTAQLGVNVVNIAGQAAALDANNLLKVDAEDWKGSAVTALVNGWVPAVTPIRSGTAQAGGASTITLDAGASATNNLYNNELIYISGGTGAGQVNTVSSYAGATKIATMISAWATNPDNTSTFIILPAGPISATVSGGVNVTQWNGSAVATPNIAGVPKVDVTDWLGTAVTAATAGIPDTNAKNINNVSTASVTTVSANVGTTQPVNFTGTAGAALVKTDVTDIATVAVNTGTAQLGVNVVNAGGTAWGSGAITAASIAAAALNGKGDWLLASSYTAPDNADIQFCRNVLEGDEFIDTTTTPWNRVVDIKQTSTQLIRKKLRDVSGNNIGATTTVIGSSKDL